MENSKRVVIKIGSTLIANKKGEVRREWLNALADDVAMLKNKSIEVIIVSSGAVTLGKGKLGFTKAKNSLKLEHKQAAAACGQVDLAEAYSSALSRHNIDTAQVLLTIEDSENRRRYLNARSTLETLLKGGVVPVINENDTVATEEIRVGDNDRLAARVAQMIEADTLILLSDVDGLYTANPKNDKSAKHVAKVEDINQQIEKMADGAGSFEGSGGMITKIAAAKIATNSGCTTIITLGEEKNPISCLIDGAVHTIFVAKGTPDSARKCWIADSLNVMGETVVDEGAALALGRGKSLLPAGVISVGGSFERGDCISIKNTNGEEIGRGLSAYSSQDAEKILGHNTSEIEKILGFCGRDAMIHRDDMVLSWLPNLH